MLKRYDITLPSDYEEPMLGLAERFGISAFSSPQIRDEGMGETDFVYTGETIVSFVASDMEQNTDEIEKAIQEFLVDFGLPRQNIKIKEYSEKQDWMEKFKKHFKPICVGESIVVRPPWEKPLPQEGKTAQTILIVPGMAFGTGTHETTRLCLKFLEKMNLENQSFLDLGAGSGILSFYLMKRNASDGVAIEIEGPAVENMKKNAALNNISNKLEMICADLGKYKPNKLYDGIVANITSPVILEYLPVFSPWVKKDGWGVFSGVNVTNAPLVKKAFADNGWDDLQENSEGDWCGFYLKKK